MLLPSYLLQTAGQAHQIIPQPTQQYRPTMYSGQVRQTLQRPTDQYHTTIPIQQPTNQYHTTMPIQQPTHQYHTTMPTSLPPAVNMASHPTPQSSTQSSTQNSAVSPDDELAVPGHPHYHYHPNSTSSLNCPRQTEFPGLSTAANHWDRSFAPPDRTHIAYSSNVNIATQPFVTAADPWSHVADTSIDAAISQDGASNGSEAASALSSSSYDNRTQSNDAMIDNTAQAQFQTAKSIPFDEYIPSMANVAPSPHNTYRHPPATNTNQYIDYVPLHNPPTFHSAQYSNTVTRDDLPPSSLPPMSHPLQYVSPNQDLTPAHGVETLYGSQSAGPPYQPAPPMAHSPPFYPRPDLPHRNSLSRPSCRRRRKSHTQEPQPSPSPTYSCYWVKEDNTFCGHKGSEIKLRKHFRTHLSGPQNALIKCRWLGCQYKKRTDSTVNTIRRDSMWRHVRERHLKIKRPT
jgi:hypothetical protein